MNVKASALLQQHPDNVKYQTALHCQDDLLLVTAESRMGTECALEGERGEEMTNVRKKM